MKYLNVLIARILAPERFSLNPEYFPQETKDVLSSDLIVKYGVLPLGAKKRGSGRVLNLGFLEVSDRQVFKRVRLELQSEISRHGFSANQAFQVEPRPFLEVLEKSYGLDLAKLREQGEVCLAIRAYL